MSFRGQEYESNNYDVESEIKRKKVSAVDKGQFSMAKVILWLGLGLLITGIVSLGMPDLLTLIANSNASAAQNFYLTIMIVSAVLLIPSLIVINFQAFGRHKGLMITFYAIYSVAVGVFLSALFLTLFYESPTSFIRLISLAFLITAAVFVIFGIIGSRVKINHLVLWVTMMSLMGGALTLSLIGIFMPDQAQLPIYLVITGAILLYMMLMVLIDFNNIKRISQNSELISNPTNLEIYCAYSLYVDFIYIFIRILILLSMGSKNRR